MNNNLIDNRISNENKVEFNKRGWTLVDLKLSENILNNSIRGLNNMKRSSINKDYKPRRIYYDHFFSNNLAAIELPFNKIICNEDIRNLFKEAKIGSLVKTLMGWENPCNDLSRLFCMGNYKYRGNWHRDYVSDLNKINLNSNLRDVLLVGIYLLPQKGFRILKRDFEFNGEKSIVLNEKIDNAIRSFPFPLSPPKESFDEIDGKVGTALFFDPLLLHQGSNYNDRLDFHMKFCDSPTKGLKNNQFQDFSVIDILHEDYELTKNNSYLKDRKLSVIPFQERSNIFQRLSNTIDYRTGLRRVFKLKSLLQNPDYKILKKAGWRIDFLSNTLFQR